MRIEINSKLKITGAPESLKRSISDRLTFPNPKFLEAERMGRWTGDIPEFLQFYEIAPDGTLTIPRGFAHQLFKILSSNGIRPEIIDHRRTLPEVDFHFTGTLKPFQQEAVDAMLKKDSGVLSAATGSGKTIMALDIIAVRKQPTLIIVHTKELLNQWIERIETFLGIPRTKIGVIGSGKRKIGHKITVGLVQSIYKCADEVSKHIGFLVVDECHRVSSRTFTEAVSSFDSKYMLGLSATPWRRDGLSRLIYWHLGDVQHEVDKDDLIENGDILRAEVITRQTDFRPFSDPTTEYSRMLSELTEDFDRNRLIASDVAQEARRNEGIALVLSDRKAHCEALQAALSKYGIDAALLTGDLPAKQRQETVEKLNSGQVKVLVATGQLIGEGFDCKALSTLFLATPIRFSGRVLQYLGRVLRPAPGKEKAVVYDYLDVNVGPLVSSARSRQRVYSKDNHYKTSENFMT